MTLDFENDSRPKAPPAKADIVRLTKLAQSLLDAQDVVVDLTAELADAVEVARHIEQEALPELMKEFGLTEITLESGAKVSILADVQCSISEDRRGVAHAWLRKNGFEGLIKSALNVAFDRSELENAEEAAFMLSILTGQEIVLKETIHPQTLKSFVKERMEAGKPPPSEPFGLHPFNRAKVTLPKAPKRKK